MRKKHDSERRQAEEPAASPLGVPLDVRERLTALLESVLRQIYPELRQVDARRRDCPKTAHEALARVELDGFLYVLSRVPARRSQRSLSPRELEVVRLVAEGLQTKEIAAALGIQPPTVATHLRRIRNKLKVDSRAALAQEYLALS